MHLIGSFQKNIVRITESPIDEVWARIGQLSSDEYIQKVLPQNNSDLDWGEFTSFISVRIQQSIELWTAYKNSTLLTSPLSLYYSFLNIHRAFLALVPEVMPKPSHGLVFNQNADLFSSSAKLVKGSFTDWLDTCGVAWEKDSLISLEECLKSCPELKDEFPTYFNDTSCVATVQVNGYLDKNTHLVFLDNYEDFPNTWKNDFPLLVKSCTLVTDEKATLELNEEDSKSYESISNWAANHLEPNLLYSNNSTWYSYRETGQPLNLPRSSYYYIGIFILSSIVRYQPELLLEASSQGSMHNWIVNRFISCAERYYPQMKLMELHGGQVYFSTSH